MRLQPCGRSRTWDLSRMWFRARTRYRLLVGSLAANLVHHCPCDLAPVFRHSGNYFLFHLCTDQSAGRQLRHRNTCLALYADRTDQWLFVRQGFVAKTYAGKLSSNWIGCVLARIGSSRVFPDFSDCDRYSLPADHLAWCTPLHVGAQPPITLIAPASLKITYSRFAVRIGGQTDSQV